MKDLYKKLKPYLIFLFAILGGCLLPFAFAPYQIGIAGILSPAILLWCLAKKSPAKAFLIGWCYGLGMFGLGVNWIYVSIHDYGYTTAFLAVLITSLFVVGMSLYPALMSYLLNKLFKKNDLIRCLLIFPVLWTLFEILRGWFLTGFPWLYVGYSQMSNHLHAYAPIGGVWAVSWAAVFVASTLYCIINYYFEAKQNKKHRNLLFIAMLAVWAGAFACKQILWTYPDSKAVTVALVQGNIAQLMRWDPAHISYIVQTYKKLTKEVDKANVIVWPEGAIPIPLPLSKALFEEMDSFAKSNQFALISGVPVELADQQHYYNGLISVGMGNGIYYKEHLVPFGEYVPLEQWLRGIIAFFNLPMSSFVEGPSEQGSLIAQGYHFAPAICYEIAYPLFVQSISKNADFILTVSNDSWFGTSIGPMQHLQIAQFRALETGKYVIRATNAGLTAIIEPNGEIQAIAPQFETTILSGTIHPVLGKTFWTQYGPWPLFCALGGVFALGGILRLRQKN